MYIYSLNVLKNSCF